MATVTSKDGTTIAYDIYGQGPLVVIVNGAFGYRDYHGDRELAEELSKNYTVIIYDRRGRGESTDTLPYTVDREIEDIEALIAAHGGEAYLYGVSSGAALAFLATAKLGDMVKKLAMYEPPYSSGQKAAEEFAKQVQMLKDFAAANNRTKMVELFISGFMPPEAIAAFKQNDPKEWKTMEDVVPTLVYDYTLLGDSLAPVEIAEQVSTPTLLMRGSEGLPFVVQPVEELASALPHVQQKVLEGQPHEPSGKVMASELAAFFG